MTPITGSFILGAVAMAIVLNFGTIIAAVESATASMTTRERMFLTFTVGVTLIAWRIGIALNDENTILRFSLIDAQHEIARLTKQCEPLP